MQNKNGFSSVEVLFCFVIIIVISLLTLYKLPNFNFNFDIISNQIFYVVEHAKNNSLIEHKSNVVTFENDRVFYGDYIYNLTTGYYIDNPQVISFNKNGNISMATTVQLCNDSICKGLVFNLESGHMYLQQ